MNTAELTPQGLVAAIKDLVTLPDVALRIARMVNDPNSSAADIGREVSKDPALTARLLRIANSPALGQHGKIATISRAITVLGVRQVRDLTVGLTAVRTFDGIGNELVTMASFWRHSVLCAVAATHIAERRAGGRDDSPFVAGLLHDVGQLVLFSRAPELARRALLMSVDDPDDQGTVPVRARCDGIRSRRRWSRAGTQLGIAARHCRNASNFITSRNARSRTRSKPRRFMSRIASRCWRRSTVRISAMGPGFRMLHCAPPN